MYIAIYSYFPYFVTLKMEVVCSPKCCYISASLHCHMLDNSMANCMQLSPSWEAASQSEIKEIFNHFTEPEGLLPSTDQSSSYHSSLSF
jgi:hypothetical protein